MVLLLTLLEINMNILKSRGGMTAILASLALASVTAFAQAPGGGPGGGRAGGGGGPATKESVLQRQGLTDEALKLTAAQSLAIGKLAEKMAADQTALQAKYPPAQGAPNPEAQAARAKMTEEFTAEVNKVLDATQKATWAARPQRGGGGMGGGGMGGGAGGPPPGGAPR
jgi:hypothetical protein